MRELYYVYSTDMRAGAVEDAGVQSDAHHAPSRIKILI